MVYDVLYSSIKRYPENTALEDVHSKITYRELGNLVVNFADRLRSLGFRSGEKVLIWFSNSIEFVTAYFGINLAGGIVVLADTKLNHELLGVISENSLKWIVTDSVGAEKLKGLVNSPDFKGGSSLKVILAEDKGFFQQQDNSCNKSFMFPEDANPDSISTILYTSGSSGKPKAVVNSHRTLEEAIINYTDTLNVTSVDRFIAVTPFFHSYAFGSCMLAAISRGAALLVHSVFQPRKILKSIASQKATFFHGVPYMYSLLTDILEHEKYELTSVRCFISAGGPLDKDISKRFYSATGRLIHQEYGSSETGTIAVNLSEDLHKNLDSVGRPLKNVAIRAIDVNSDGNTLLQVKSKGMSLGYLNTEAFERDWYTTGDIVELDEDGYIHITGRYNRLINISGLKVNPVEVEALIMEHPLVVDVKVSGKSHGDYGEIVEAEVIRKNDTLTQNELIKFCQKKLALFKVPKIINWVDFIPKSGTGKNINL